MKHTPGKWCVESDGTTVAMGGQCVIVAPAPDGASFGEQKANAALIAAAPELLRSLKGALAYADALPDGPHDMSCEATPGHCSCWIDSARATIAKAEGE